MSSGIYCIINIKNNKNYIGQSRNLSSRKIHHFYLLRHERHNNRYLQKDFQKYGECNFSYCVLEKCSKQLLNKKEIYWIKYYKTIHPKGYNLTAGGTTNQEISKQARINLSKAQMGNKYCLGNKLTNEHKINLSKALKGRKFSKQHKLKISKTLMGHFVSKKTKYKQSQAKKNYIPWNKGIDKLKIKKICPICKQTFKYFLSAKRICCSRKCSNRRVWVGRKHSEKTKQKISKSKQRATFKNNATHF